MSQESSASEAVDVVLYLFVLGPAVEWCLKSPRVNGGRPGSRRGIALAVCLLAAIAGEENRWAGRDGAAGSWDGWATALTGCARRSREAHV